MRLLSYSRLQYSVVQNSREITCLVAAAAVALGTFHIHEDAIWFLLGLLPTCTSSRTLLCNSAGPPVASCQPCFACEGIPVLWSHTLDLTRCSKPQLLSPECLISILCSARNLQGPAPSNSWKMLSAKSTLPGRGGVARAAISNLERTCFLTIYRTFGHWSAAPRCY